ncbi:MAG: hypothetical protein ACFHX7_06425 [Pseudomonadota bacterium]
MKYLPVKALVVLLSLVGFSVNAAEVIVEPGTGTLKAAVDAASAGDTIVLKDGDYIMVGMAVTKDLDFKAQTNTSPRITTGSSNSTQRTITLGSTSTPVSVSFTGIQFAGMTLATLSGAEDVELIIAESRITNSAFATSTITDSPAVLESLIFIGNVVTGSPLSFQARDMIVAGNTFVLPDNDGGSYNISARATAHVIGNEFRADYVRGTMLLIQSGQNYVAANRFYWNFAEGSDIPIQSNGSYTVLYLSGAITRVQLNNNLFKIVLPAEFQPDPGDPLDNTNLQFIKVVDNDITSDFGVTFENNTVDFGMTADTVNFVQTSPVIETSSAVIVRNNLIANTTRPLIDFTSTPAIDASVIEFNMCDTVLPDLCYGSDVVAGSADFVDADDYVLGASSDATDAGKPLGLYNDVDGTRNDLGAYGGAFPIDQYDVQRTDGRVEPFLYPLFTPNKNVTGDGKLNVRVIGLARSK